MQTATSQPAIYSEFGNDPDMGELVELFVAEMPDRIEAIVQALRANDFESLRYLSHQLKGAAGSYGFHQLTPFAATVEKLVDDRQGEAEICNAVEELVGQCQRVRAGQEV